MDEAMIKYGSCNKEVWGWMNFDKITGIQLFLRDGGVGNVLLP